MKVDQRPEGEDEDESWKKKCHSCQILPSLGGHSISDMKVFPNISKQ
jgi:hypothetical protein